MLAGLSAQVLLATVVGTSAFFLVRLLRLLLPGLAGRRPIGCDTCASAWISVGLLAIAWADGRAAPLWRYLILTLPSAAIALILLEWTATLRPVDGPPLPPA